MKFRLQLKDPVGVDHCVENVALNAVQGDPRGVEFEVAYKAERERVADFLRTWVWSGERMVLEFDTETGVVVVLPVAGW